MYEKSFIGEAIKRSATTDLNRRRMFTMVGIAGAGAAAATLAGGTVADAATKVDDPSVLNFALNLEYLEAEFYLRAATGSGLTSADIGGTGKPGAVSGGKKVPFTSKVNQGYADEIANDERTHVRFLRKALGKYAVARPAISLDAAFNAAAVAAGVADSNGKFDPFANETNFLLGAFLFEDVGVTAYKGAAGLIANKTYLSAAAGILAVEAYHAGAIRTLLTGLAETTAGPSLMDVVKKISDARDSLDGSTNLDQGIGSMGHVNLTPTDNNAIAFGRTPGQVLNVVYLNPKPVKKGGFFPAGVNGAVNTSA